MVKWLKTLFKKAEIEEYNIQLERLFDWFMDQSTPRVDEEKQQLRAMLQQVRGAQGMLKEKLNLLAEAPLMNAALPEKERQVMLGNREAYVRSMTGFANGVHVPDDFSYEKLLNFVAAGEESMQQAIKATARNYYVLNHFFANEVRDTADQLKRMEEQFTQLKQTKLADVARIKKKINELEDAVKQKGGRAENIQKEKQALTLMESMIASAESQMHQLKTGKAFQELELLQKQMAGLKAKLANHQDVLAKSFTGIERLIKMYCAQYPDEARLFEAYLANPGDALLSDTNVLIIDGLARLRGTILTGQFQFDDKQRHEAIARINELSIEHLKNTAALMGKINEQILDTYKRIRLNNVQREIEELEYKIAHLKAKQATGAAKLKKVEKKETKQDSSALREEVEEQIHQFLDMPINIIIEGEEDGEEGEEGEKEREESDEDEEEDDER